MNYININDFNEEKILIPKKNYYCSNCNLRGHTFKNCKEPIISNGIIAIQIENFNKNLISVLEKYLIDNLKIYSTSSNNKYNKSEQYYLENHAKFKNSLINTNIKFLMVQRKNSLGYLEFIRGRYMIDNKESIKHLVEQMSPNEINDILKLEFDDLWNNLWDNNNIRNKNHYKEYMNSKQKFYVLKLNDMKGIKENCPLYNYNEWGFPKGRRESHESDLVCAVREFEEETFFKEDTYILLEKCNSIRENLIGTNNKKYAHNYYLAILNENTITFDKSNKLNKEIGDLKILNINECLELIRPYHKNKIIILKNIYKLIENFLKEYKDT